MLIQAKKHIISLIIIVVVIAITLFISAKNFTNSSKFKINGVNFVAPRKFVKQVSLMPIKNINCNWVSITPFAFSRANQPNVIHSTENQWWGEKPEGVNKTIEYAHNLGLKVMLKPHVWVHGQGWAGDYILNSDEEWEIWFHDYTDYILTFAEIAQNKGVEMFCIGTEFRKAATLKPKLWKKLITAIREIYFGKLTYAANWDNYNNITFWKELDYIGIDAYFPLSDQKTPSISDLNKKWLAINLEIELFSKKWKKPILFTEYGYESRDYATDGQWKYNRDTLHVNLKAQVNAYSAMYSSFWKEEWFLGGFLWKWHAKHENAGGISDKRFTPQNKPVEIVIKRHNQSFN